MNTYRSLYGCSFDKYNSNDATGHWEDPETDIEFINHLFSNFLNTITYMNRLLILYGNF